MLAPQLRCLLNRANWQRCRAQTAFPFLGQGILCGESSPLSTLAGMHHGGNAQWRVHRGLLALYKLTLKPLHLFDPANGCHVTKHAMLCNSLATDRDHGHVVNRFHGISTYDDLEG
jgi:hypothetical protein